MARYDGGPLNKPVGKVQGAIKSKAPPNANNREGRVPTPAPILGGNFIQKAIKPLVAATKYTPPKPTFGQKAFKPLIAATKYTPPNTNSPSTNSPTGDPGGDGGGGGGDGGGASVDPAAVDASITPIIPDYKDDSEFIAAIADLKSALGDFQANTSLKKGQYNTGVGTTFNRLGWDPTTRKFKTSQVDPNSLYNQSYGGTQNDFAARGMADSGFLLQGLGKVDQDYQNRIGDTTTAQSDYMTGLDNDVLTYYKQNNSQLLAAQRAAAQRLAQRYTLDQNNPNISNNSGLGLGVSPDSITEVPNWAKGVGR